MSERLNKDGVAQRAEDAETNQRQYSEADRQHCLSWLQFELGALEGHLHNLPNLESASERQSLADTIASANFRLQQLEEIEEALA